MTATEVDFNDVQGLVRFGYKKMTEASYALLRIKNAGAARAWLAGAHVTSAVTASPPPPTALHVAFTAPGLEALGVPAAVRAAFSPEFLGGMTESSRARRLGDIGPNGPESWEWGYGAATPHLTVMFFAEPGRLDKLMQDTTTPAWNDAFEKLGVLTTASLDGIEPFGFADGISQPVIDWTSSRSRSDKRLTDYTNVSALGEFLLGYRNEYDKYTDRPLLDAGTETAGLLPAEDAPDKKDLGRNGTYLVMRTLQQDVRGFWRFVYQQAGDPVKAEELAAAFVGRTRAGEPLASIRDRAIEGIGPDKDEVRLNQFTFEGDESGARCPFGAHIRRANPRNLDYPGRQTPFARLLTALGLGPRGFRDDTMSSVRFHRILRRGREYGSSLSLADVLSPAPPDDQERGLHFISLNANICRQFEFLQNAWMVSTKFSALTDESDPIVGTRDTRPGCPVTSTFTRPDDRGLPGRVFNLPRFVTVRGGAYFFLPSLRALRYLASPEQGRTARPAESRGAA